MTVDSLKMRLLLSVLSFFVMLQSAVAQDARIQTNSIRLVHADSLVQLTFDLDFSHLAVEKDEIVLVQPSLVAGGQEKKLTSVGIYGRNPYYFYVRSGNRWLQAKDDIMFRAKNMPVHWEYAVTVPYEAWMDSANVEITISGNDYCDGVTAQSAQTVYTATPQVVEGNREVKITKMSASGVAHVDYVVNITRLDSEYHDNVAELNKISQTIDSVRSDTANIIRGITIKGWASPEGPYDNNVRLAKGRSESLTEYIAKTHGLDRSLMHVEYEPEDWPGFRRFVAEGDLPHKIEILRIIDDNSWTNLDGKLNHIRQTFRKEWDEVMLPKYMPYLRHSDYRIDFDHQHLEFKEGKRDTVWTMPVGELLPDTYYTLPSRRLTWALKTNLLFDAALAFNFEIEVAFGKYRNWSILVEDWFPWYVWHHNHRAYEVWNVGVELRKWRNKCYGNRPFLTGNFWGPYVASGKYDIERHGKGEQGEYFSAGFTYGHSWVLSRHWNFEASASLGFFTGPQRHYHGEFNDRHLIWKENRHFFYAGPTKLKLSLVWLLPNLLKKGGGK